MLYKNTQFHTRDIEDLKMEVDLMVRYRDKILQHKNQTGFMMANIQKDYDDLKSMNEKECYQMVFRWITEGKQKAIFLQDANTLVMKVEWLAELISYVKEKLPELERITSYGRAQTLAKISKEEYAILAKAGLNRIHSGFESGSNAVLDLIGKGGTQEDEIVGGKKVREAGMELSIYFMPGVGGRAFAEENAIETAKVINEVNPDFVRLRTFVLKNGSLMEDLRDNGLYIEQTDLQKLVEIREMLGAVDVSRATGMLKSDHIINLMPNIEGQLNLDTQAICTDIDAFLALPQQQIKEYQLARRMGYTIDWKRMETKIPERERMRIVEIAKGITDETAWEQQLHYFMEQYI